MCNVGLACLVACDLNCLQYFLIEVFHCGCSSYFNSVLSSVFMLKAHTLSNNNKKVYVYIIYKILHEHDCLKKKKKSACKCSPAFQRERRVLGSNTISSSRTAFVHYVWHPQKSTLL